MSDKSIKKTIWKGALQLNFTVLCTHHLTRKTQLVIVFKLMSKVYYQSVVVSWYKNVLNDKNASICTLIAYFKPKLLYSKYMPDV